MPFILLRPRDIALLQQLDHPPRIEIHTKANPPAMLCQVLNCQPQSPWTARPQHQPIRALWKGIIWQRLRKLLIVDPEILVRNPRLRNARRPARLKYVNRLVAQTLRHPPPHRTSPQPVIFEESKTIQILIGFDFLPRIPSRLRREVEP